MKRRAFLPLLFCGLALTWPLCLANAGVDAPCSERTFEGDSFIVCRADLARDDVRLFWKRADGSDYGAAAALPGAGLIFASNAGMFKPDYTPAGLHVEGGRMLAPLNRRQSGYGNFHMQPNGVFWIANRRAHVTTTATFAKSSVTPTLATQSGPMLVIDGKLHPRFEPDGSSRYVRNGVGVGGDGVIAFATSVAPVSFGKFGRLFRDGLKSRNALYLDGSVTELFVPGMAHIGGGRRLGPLIGVYRRQPK